MYNIHDITVYPRIAERKGVEKGGSTLEPRKKQEN